MGTWANGIGLMGAGGEGGGIVFRCSGVHVFMLAGTYRWEETTGLGGSGCRVPDPTPPLCASYRLSALLRVTLWGCDAAPG